MPGLTKDALLKRVKTKKVDLQGGEHVFIRSLPADMIYGDAADLGDRFAPKAVYYSLCDEKGAPLFGDGEESEVRNITLDDFNTIMAAISELNGLKKPDGGDGVGQAEKN